MYQALAYEQCGLSSNLSRRFQELWQFLIEVSHQYIIDDPACTYNCHETGFLMQPKLQKVIAHKDDKHIYQAAGKSSKKTQITVMLCDSAMGH